MNKRWHAEEQAAYGIQIMEHNRSLHSKYLILSREVHIIAYSTRAATT